MNTAIILAAGNGSRMKTDIKKQYLELRGKPVIAHTLDVFEASSLIDEIILVVGCGEEQYCKTEIVEKYGYTKVSKLVHGGIERQDSVRSGLAVVDARCKIVLIHDGARPLITTAMLKICTEGAMQWGAASAGVPIKETVKLVDKEGFVSSTPNREDVWITQTPQAFHIELIRTAHLYAVQNNIKATDDAMLVELMGSKVKMLQCSYENIKLTTPEDLITAEGLLRLRSCTQ